MIPTLTDVLHDNVAAIIRHGKPLSIVDFRDEGRLPIITILAADALLALMDYRAVTITRSGRTNYYEATPEAANHWRRITDAETAWHDWRLTHPVPTVKVELLPPADEDSAGSL